jgi:NAD(P) transhydrogenase subunit alpha
VGVLAEAAAERRVALAPDGVGRLRAAGLNVAVVSGAGEGASISDDEYAAAGAVIASSDDVVADSDLLAVVRRPADSTLGALRRGQLLVGLLQPLTDTELVRRCADAGVTAVSLDALPRTLSRAQPMDALSSQASVAGYKAVVVAADRYDRYFPMLMTAAGTMPPARVLVLGAGVAGLQAIGAARRLGAVVSAYDVRPASRSEVESLGATFLALESVADASGTGGYARALTADEQEAQQQELDQHVARHDIVITTAQVPGRTPPVLVTEEAVKNMRAGSVIVDLAASELGGNVELSQPEATVVTDNGVTVVGAGNLPSAMASAASAAYSRNIGALIAHLVRDGEVVLDFDDEITNAVVVTHDGIVRLGAAS